MDLLPLLAVSYQDGDVSWPDRLIFNEAASIEQRGKAVAEMPADLIVGVGVADAGRPAFEFIFLVKPDDLKTRGGMGIDDQVVFVLLSGGDLLV